MIDWKKYKPQLSPRARLALSTTGLLALGAIGGATATATARPSVEMAPVVPVAIASLPQRDGLVTIKGKVGEVYGDRFTVADASGRTLVATGAEGRGLVSAGAPVLVQGRYANGQLRASYLVNGQGQIDAVGAPPPPPPPRDRPGPDSGRGFPPPPPGAPGMAPPPPPPGGPGMAPPPPVAMAANGQPGMMPPPPPGGPGAPPPPGAPGMAPPPPAAGQPAPPPPAR